MVQLLKCAGLAVKALTKPTSDFDQQGIIQPSTISQQKESFGNATSQYFSLLSSVDVRLRRQIYALREVEILPMEAATRQGRANSTNHSQVAATASVLNAKQLGGLGNLNVGWLNSRNDDVGKKMEAELWEEALGLVERLEEAETTGLQDIEAQIEMDGHDIERSPLRDKNSKGEIV